MPRIILNVREDQKALWVDQAFEERVSLAEWIRRRCDAGLGAGGRDRTGTGGDVDASVGPRHSLSAEAAAPAPSSFRPDPKGGLGSGEVSRAGFSPVAAAASPVPSPCPGDVPAGTRCKLCGKKH